MDKRFTLISLYMYEKHGESDYSAILIAESKDQFKDLFYTAMSNIDENHSDLEISSFVIGHDLDINAILPLIRNSSYEEKAIITPHDIQIDENLPDLTTHYDEFLKGVSDERLTNETDSAMNLILEKLK